MTVGEEPERRECAHPACRCPAREGEEYCGEQCEKAQGETDCGCGHPECRARA
jgi:metallothionein